MGKFYELASRAMEKSEEYEVWDTAGKLIDKIEKRDPVLYDELISHMEKLAYRIPKEDAERIVRDMRPKGQNWSYQQITDFVKSRGIDSCWTNWYLVMNMVYNDFCNTARAYGLQNDPEFFFSLAKDFIEDPDAKPLKVEKYFIG